MIAITDAKIKAWASETRAAAKASMVNAHDRDAIHWPEIDAGSIVFEVGSFKGRWALQMTEKYAPRMYCFEPQLWAYETTRHVLSGHNAKVYNFGLGDKTTLLPMGRFGTDGCSFILQDKDSGKGQIRDIAEVLPEIGVSQIDLLMMNIQSYEYDLIPHMFKSGIFPDRLVVQFHGDHLDYLKMVDLIGLYYSEDIFNYGMTLRAWRI